MQNCGRKTNVNFKLKSFFSLFCFVHLLLVITNFSMLFGFIWDVLNKMRENAILMIVCLMHKRLELSNNWWQERKMENLTNVNSSVVATVALKFDENHKFIIIIMGKKCVGYNMPAKLPKIYLMQDELNDVNKIQLTQSTLDKTFRFAYAQF